MRARFLCLLLALLSGGVPIAAARAQTPPLAPSAGTPVMESPPAPAGPSPSSAASTGVSSVAAAASPLAASPLDTFLLRDSKGNLVPVLGMTFEEFEQLLKAKKGLAAPPAPEFVLDSLSLKGTVADQVAELQVKIALQVSSDDWVRVPLLMRSAVIRQTLQHEGPGECLLAFDDAAGGYVCWLKGRSATPHIVTLSMAVSVTMSGEERRIELTLPRATESSLKLNTEAPGVMATILEGSGIVSSRDQAGGSEIAVLGPAGKLALAWRAGRRPSALQTAQLDASGEVLVRVESEHRVTSDARLRVRSFGAPLETFRVRLPPAMELVPINLAGYSLTPILSEPADEAAKGRSALGQLVEVRLDRPTTAPADVRLLATLQADVGPTSGLQPARFEVEGAVRQRGTIDFLVDGEWQLDWTDDRSVRRLDLTPDTTSRAVARYEYFRQPCELQVKVSARPSRISMEPAHSVFLDSRQARIKTTFKSRFRGSRATKLPIELGDWKLLRLAPAELFEFPLDQGERTGRLEIPIRSDAMLPTEIDIEVEAYRLLPADQERISLTFPRPLVDTVTPASISITAAENLELTPVAMELVGLSPDPAPRTASRPQNSLHYRDLGSSEPAQFTATLRRRSRLLTASGHATVKIDRRRWQVEQRIDYYVAHEPQRSFALRTPRLASAASNLQLWFEGEPLTIEPIDESPDIGLGREGAPALVQFSLPSERLGTFQIVARYHAPLSGWDGQKSIPLELPLVLPEEPGDYQFSGQQIEFVLPEGMQVEPVPAADGDSFQPSSLLGARASPAYSWPAAADLTSWIVAPAQAVQTAHVVVERMCVQTWLTPNVRQERAIFQIRSPQESIRVRLPKGVPQTRVRVAVDGVEVTKAFRDPGQIVLTLPTAARNGICVLELFYALDPPASRLGLATGRLLPAQIDGATPPRRSYWQLGLPEGEHLLTLPREMTAEMDWDAGRWLVTRRPSLDQLQLQRWIGASRQEALPRSANLYLFGGLGEPPVLETVIAQRSLLIASASGAILLVGLLLLHVSRLRSPSFLLALAVVLLATAWMSPDLALLAGQSALLGLALAAGAALWSGLRSGRTRVLPSPSTITRRVSDSAVQSAAVVRPDRSSQITATAAAAAIEVRP